MSGAVHGAEQRRSVAQLKGEVLDVLVVGGGIVGAGVARDAAMRGLRVGLIDRRDFAFGTSSRSSRLLHGGLRYLAQGRLRLVREASVEKMTIARIAPHLVEPLAFTFPTRRGTQWKRWKLRLGVKVYDWLCRGGNLGRSSGLSASQVMRLLPGLGGDDLTGAVRYFDALTSDARLVLDTLRSAAGHGAVLCNYASLREAQREGDAWRCGVMDEMTGAGVTLGARTVVNAAGAWAAGLGASRVRLRLTKGVHLVIERGRLPIPDAVVMAEGSRILFAIPWGDRVILGTTDTDYDGAIDSPAAEPRDVQYILDVTNAYFPTAKLGAEDIISTWAGLRPLVSGGGDQRGRPSDISRRHQIAMSQPGWIDVAGGKLTTYRLMAEQTVDALLRHLGRDAAACRTAQEPLLREPRPPFSGILPPEFSREAVEHYCREEWAQHLDDVMIRRTSWRYYHREHMEIAAQVAAWMAELCGWDADRSAQELERYRGMLEKVTPAPTAVST